ncbi:MAG: glycosyltransferase, partial [Candidatus Electrothrix sp. GM3_4]|nr:glycosyltransferase [Candidatus Electrothrix sp. GM3_4]
VYICPIRDGGGTKLKLLDAFSMKKAVVAHPVACEGINAQPDHDVFFAETPNEFVDKISMLFADAELRQATGENARKMVSSLYSYESIGGKLSEMYELLYSSTN